LPLGRNEAYTEDGSFQRRTVVKADSIAPFVSAVVLSALAVAVSAQVGVWTSHGPGGFAQVNDVLVADATAYAATLNGVFRSDDGGMNWQPSGLQRLPIVRILPRPGTPALLALAGGRTGTLYASPDAGLSWQALPLPDYVVAAGVDPGQSSTFYAATPDGEVWRSGDAGSTWQSVSSGFGIVDFAFGSGGIYALNSGGLYKSTDAGATWSSVQPPGSFFSSALAVGSATGVVYTAGSGGFCRSADSAATWSCASSTASYSVSRILEVADSSASTPRLLLATDRGTLMSKDGGITWGGVASGLLGAHVQALGSDASGSLVLAGTDIRMFRSADRGDTWTDHSAGLQSVWSSGLVLDPSNPMTLWTGGIGSYPSGPGLFRSADRGLSWSSAGGSEGPGLQTIWAIALDPQRPTTMYVGAGGLLYRSDDGGGSWSTPLSSQAQAIAVDPSSPQTVLAGGAVGVSRSGDGGLTWQTSALTQGVYALLFDRRDPNRVYAGSYWDVDYDYGEIYGGSIFVSNDHGATFTKASTQFGNPVNAIVADPFLDSVVYAGGQGVFRSTDGGASWTASTTGLNPPNSPFLVAPDLGVLRIVADPVRPGTLYCSTTYDLFRSTDGGQTWETFSDGLEPLEVVELAISSDGTKLHAGTAGGGVFERDLAADLALPCVPSSTRLCLIGARYAIDLYAALPGGGGSPGAARALGDRAGSFAFPRVTGSSELPEVVVKMLPGGSLGGPGEGAPVFYASLTTLPYSLIVTDTTSGTRKIYSSHPDAPLCGGADLSFGGSAATAGERTAAGSSGGGAVSLLGGRFSVALVARWPLTGAAASTLAMASGDSYAFFSFPGVSGDPQFPEVVVKMIDARSIDGKFWFFRTDLTTLDYTLTVKDLVTGVTRLYESGTPFCGGADTEAFTDSP
jgi:hypothetical protein